MKGVSLDEMKGRAVGKRGNSPNGAFPTNGPGQSFLPQIGGSPLLKNAFAVGGRADSPNGGAVSNDTNN